MGRNTCVSFEGFQYTHATLVKFNKRGDIVWDNTFEMYPLYKPFVVKRFITMKQDSTSVNLAFGNGNQLKYKVINPENGHTEKDESQEIIDTQLENDKVRRSFSNVEYWFDNNFVAYGIQKISNNEVKRKKRIFFVNKVSFNNH